MRAIIIDDEEPAIKILTSFAKKIPFLKIELATTDAFEALDFLNNSSIDLIFLDIEMPDITGINFVKSLNEKPQIIFTTAYEEYALKGYDLDITDYLLKPIRFERFLKAVNKANKLSRSSKVDESQNFISVKSEYKTYKILFEDILYVEGLKDYVKIHTTNKTILTRLNVKGIESKLPADKFIRIHRSFIVSLSKIESYQKAQITIEKKTLPIGKTYLQDFERSFQ